MEIRKFQLSPPGKGVGVSCDENGLFVGATPLLKRFWANGMKLWQTIDCDLISDQIGEQFGVPIDMSCKMGGLNAIADALSAGDIVRAQIASVLLGIPDPPLSKSTHSTAETLKFIRALQWSGLIKADWDPDQHPRWPAGAPDSQGGEFAPKGDDSNADYSPALRFDSSDRTPRMQLADAGISDAVDDPVVEATGRAAEVVHHDSTKHLRPKLDGDPKDFWQTVGSRVLQDVHSAFSEIGQAQINESSVENAAANMQARAIIDALRDYSNYRRKPWIELDENPVPVSVIGVDDPYTGVTALTAYDRSDPNAPLMRPGSNADWIDSLVDLVSAGAAAAGPTFRLAGPAEEALESVVAPAAQSDVLIGNSKFRTIGDFTDAVTVKYQMLYDDGHANVLEHVSRGLLPNDPLVIGKKTDLFARTGLRDWLTNVEGIDEGGTQIIRVNRRLYNLLGSGDYRVPDVYIPGSQTILDGSLQFKSGSMRQIQDFQEFSGGATIIIVRPSTARSDLVVGSYGIVR